MRVKIKVNGRRLSIPVPYFCLRIIIAVLTSKRAVAYVNQAIEKGKKTSFRLPQLNKEDVKPLIRELSKYRGLQVVETKVKDGTEVSVKL